MMQGNMRAQSVEPIRVYEAPPLLAELPLNSGDAPRRSSGATVVARGRALFWQGEQQGQNIEIVEGVVRAVRLIENGNRQVLAFFWPGDVVRPAKASCQHYTAEAVTTCRVIKSNATDDVCMRSDLCGAHQVLEETLSLVLMMGQKSIVARVASLLLRIRRHLPSDQKLPSALQILLPRADMADYIGTSLETVCRTLAEFKARKLIELPTRKTIRFIDLKGLSAIAEA
jgi:CRP-like cAMP-binding protein